MAETPVAPNNKSITFGTKMEREMSTAPTRLNAEAQPVDGAVSAAPSPVKKKRITAGARKKAKSAIKHGMISEKAAKKHLGGY
jgi:hypothetical protein